MALLFAFDMDGVVYDYAWQRRMTLMSELSGLPVAELSRRWWDAGRGEGVAEAGGFATGVEYLAALNAALGSSLSVEDFMAVRRSSMVVRPAVVATIRRAAQLGRVTVLTNNGALVDERLPELAPELASTVGVEHLRASSRYRARKPDPLVFRRMLGCYGAQPADTFFTDDQAENVEGASAVGITAHLYADADRLRSEVEAFAADRGRR